MREQTVEDRIAALEEHIVSPPTTTPEEFLARAEKAVARGDEREALHCLTMARIHHSIDRIEAIADGWDEEEGDDDA